MASIRLRGGRFEARARVVKKTVSRTFSSLEEAKKWALGIELGVLEPESKKTAPRASMSLLEASNRYLSEVAIRHKGYRQACERVRQISRLDWCSEPLESVSATHVRDLRDRMLSQGLSASTVRLMMNTISVIYGHARREWGLNVVNPTVDVRMPSPPKARHRRLSEDEERALFASLSLCRNPHMRPAAVFALETAMRRGELLALLWSDVDVKGRVAHLRDTKNGLPRWVPLSQGALEVLEGQRRWESERVFPISVTLLSQAWGHAVKRAGLRDLRWHDLRHESLSRWAHRLGGDVFKLSLVSGHRTLQMAQRYVHPVQAELLGTLLTR